MPQCLPFARLLGLFLAAAGIGGTVLMSCSLRPLAQAELRLPAKLRDNPALQQMTHFLVAFSGGSLSNTVSSADVNFRSLGCLGMSGHVFFSYTLDQLTSGVSLAVSPGTYQATILGFAATGSPAT